VVVVAAAVLGLTAFAVVVNTYRVRDGELAVRTGGRDIRLTIARDGRLVQPATDRRFFTLPPGTYDVRMVEPSEGLRIVPGRVVVERAKRAVVTVEATATAR
jgi:hypothetical protein